MIFSRTMRERRAARRVCVAPERGTVVVGTEVGKVLISLGEVMVWFTNSNHFKYSEGLPLRYGFPIELRFCFPFDELVNRHAHFGNTAKHSAFFTLGNMLKINFVDAFRRGNELNFPGKLRAIGHVVSHKLFHFRLCIRFDAHVNKDRARKRLIGTVENAFIRWQHGGFTRGLKARPSFPTTNEGASDATDP